MPIVTFSEFDALKVGLVRSLRGRVLEIGAGRGSNFRALAADVSWTGLEPNARSRLKLSENATRAGHHTPPIASGAENIPLQTHSVDAVLGTFVLCSVSDVAAALGEIWRVVVPGGRIVLAEHVAAPAGSWKRRVQSALTPISRRLDRGCHMDRDTETALSVAFTPREVGRYEIKTGLFGVTVPSLLYDGTSDN